MSRRLVWGAGVALAAAAVVAGCSNKKSGGQVLVNSGTGDVKDPNLSEFTAITANNLASDGLAFSANGQNFNTLKCAYNNVSQVTSSSSGSGSADKSAMVCFTTTDTSSVNGPFTRLWASHWDGSTWTPPVELKGEDRDETKGISVASIVMMPLNVDNYKGSSGQALSTVASNKGNWVVLWDSTTAKKTPINDDPLNGPVQAVPATGPHVTIYYTLFVKALRSKSAATSQVLGAGGGASGTLTTASRDYEYGFLKRAIELPTFRGGESSLNTGVGANGRADQPFAGTIGARTRVSRPAEDVINFGVTSDVIRGCASYTAKHSSNALFTNGIGFASEPVPVIPGSNGAGLF